MDLLRFYTSIFTSLKNPKGLPYWILSPIRRVIRTLANQTLPKYLRTPVLYSNNVAKGVIVSLTSFPGRIGIVWQVIETLKRQSIRPEKILLWLSKEQFPQERDIPAELRSLQDDVFTIRVVDDDLRSHKKYFYVMQEFSEYTIITCDDDVYYHPLLLEYLISASETHPNNIIANVTCQLGYESGILLPYLEWQRNYKAFSSLNRVQIGIGGVLYPPNAISKKAFNPVLIKEIAPLADDLWLNCMSRLVKTPVMQSNLYYLPIEIISDSSSLHSVNNGAENMNDVQINKIREYLRTQGLDDVYSAEYQVGNN